MFISVCHAHAGINGTGKCSKYIGKCSDCPRSLIYKNPVTLGPPGPGGGGVGVGILPYMG